MRWLLDASGSTKPAKAESVEIVAILRTIADSGRSGPVPHGPKLTFQPEDRGKIPVIFIP